jgi:hypothetical protein
MADFVAVIRKAVDNLSDNTPDNRERVYSKARAAIRRQLEAMSPPPADEIVNRQMTKLDEAIAEVESEHAPAVETDESETDRLMSELEALVEDKQPPAPRPSTPVPPSAPVAPPVFQTPVVETPPESPPEAPVEQTPVAPTPPVVTASPYERQEPQWTPASPEPADQDVAPEEEWDAAADAYNQSHLEPPASEYRDDIDVAAEPDFPAEPFAPPPPAERPAVVDPTDHDAIFGLDNDRPAATAPAPESRSEPRRPVIAEKSGGRRGLTGLVLGLAVLLLLAVGGYAAWTQKDALMAMVSGNGETPAESAATTESSTPAETAADTEPSGEATETAALATDEPAAEDPDRKFTQRLNVDGSESNPGPAPELADASAPVEGRSVSAQTDGGDNQAPLQAPTTTGEAATDPAGEETAQAGEPLGVQQKMFLYEERLDQQSPAVSEGSVAWSLIDDPENGGPNNVAIRGEINTEDGNLSALVTIKRNADKSLPASHIIEIVFALPENFSGGGIDQIQRISMKQTEQDQGNPLIAVPAKITEDFYMIALNDLTEAVQTNTQLLRTRNWIDVPVIYSNGRRALITLEKGTSGSEVFNQALDVWAAG